MVSLAAVLPWTWILAVTLSTCLSRIRGFCFALQSHIYGGLRKVIDFQLLWFFPMLRLELMTSKLLTCQRKKKKTVVVYKVLWIDIWAGYTSLRFDIHIMTTHHSSLLIKLLWTQGCGIYQVRCKHDPVAIEFMIPVGKITVKTQILIFIWILCTLKLLNKVTCIFQSISF